MRVLVTGGTGFLGRATVRALVGAGHDVRLFARDERRARETFAGLPVDVVIGDLATTTDVAAGLEARHALVHVAAGYSYDRAAEATTAANAALSTSALGAALRAGVRAVDVSSLVVFALGVDRIDAATPLSGPTDSAWRDPYLRSKVLAEEAGRVLDAEGLDRVTVHPGPIIGPDDPRPGPSGGLVVRLVSGAAVPDSRVAFVDVRDVGAAIATALTAPRGARLLLTSGVHTYRELAGRVDALTGRHPRRVFLAGRVLRGLARFNDLTGGRLGDIAPAGSLDYVLRNAPVVDTSAATRLGIAFRPIDETLADTMRWWADHGIVDRKVVGALVNGSPAG